MDKKESVLVASTLSKCAKWLKAKPSRSIPAIFLAFALCLSACFGGGESEDLSKKKSSKATEKTEEIADEKTPISPVDLSVFDSLASGTQSETGTDSASGAGGQITTEGTEGNIGQPATIRSGIDAGQIPAYSGQDYIALNGNVPSFAEGDFSAGSFKYFSELDGLGRCGTAFMMAGPEYLPSQDRGDISGVYPSGWTQNNCSGTYVWNRSHLLAFSLSGENDNPKNLITGSAYMNQQVMTQFESMVRDYIKETGHHVLYRVTPHYDGNNLVAKGVQMEAQDVETRGADILFNVFVYNVQPGAEIDYASGNTSCSVVSQAPAVQQSQAPAQNIQPNQSVMSSSENSAAQDYVLNTNSKKIHLPTCSMLNRTKEQNKQYIHTTLADLHGQGYQDAQCCLR